MIEDSGLVFTNLNGVSWTFNTDTCPLKEFIVEVDMVGTEIKRMQEPGIWPHRTSPGKMLMHIVADILRDTSATYIADRLTLLNTLIPAGVVELHRKMGTIKLHYVGQEWMSADCTLDAYPSMPLQALYPSVSEVDITFKTFTPYLTGVSGRYYSI